MERLKELKKKKKGACFVLLICNFLCIKGLDAISEVVQIFHCLYSLWFVFWFCCFLPTRENAFFVILASVCPEVTILMFSEL